MRVRVASRAVGPGQRADAIEPAVASNRVHHHARIEVPAVRAVTPNDDVMRADIAVVCEALAVAVALSRPPPARGQAWMRRVREIDHDEEAISVTRLPRRGVGVPAARVPDAVHAQSVDGE